jgi:uncharacterized protein (TIGR02145 family)
MSKTVSEFALTAGLVLAMALTFSCSSDDDGGGGGGNENGGGGGDKGNDIGNYRTVVIGTQTWMAENLNYAVEGSKCYDNDPANCDKYGRLYDWATAMAFPPSCNENSCSSQIQQPHQGICPSGWHIPSKGDLDVLMEAVDTSGTKLKATSGWPVFDVLEERFIVTPDGTQDLYDVFSEEEDIQRIKSMPGWPNSISFNGTDEFGFSALPGGGGSDGRFGAVGYIGYWWSTSEDSNSRARHGYMRFDRNGVIWNGDDKSLLLSVRCLQD